MLSQGLSFCSHWVHVSQHALGRQPCPFLGRHPPLRSACWDTHPLPPSACWDTHTTWQGVWRGVREGGVLWKGGCKGVCCERGAVKTGCCERTPTPFSSQHAGGTHPIGILSCVYNIFRCLKCDSALIVHRTMDISLSLLIWSRTRLADRVLRSRNHIYGDNLLLCHQYHTVLRK